MSIHHKTRTAWCEAIETDLFSIGLDGWAELKVPMRVLADQLGTTAQGLSNQVRTFKANGLADPMTDRGQVRVNYTELRRGQTPTTPAAPPSGSLARHAEAFLDTFGPNLTPDEVDAVATVIGIASRHEARQRHQPATIDPTDPPTESRGPRETHPEVHNPQAESRDQRATTREIHEPPPTTGQVHEEFTSPGGETRFLATPTYLSLRDKSLSEAGPNSKHELARAHSLTDGPANSPPPPSASPASQPAPATTIEWFTEAWATEFLADWTGAAIPEPVDLTATVDGRRIDDLIADVGRQRTVQALRTLARHPNAQRPAALFVSKLKTADPDWFGEPCQSTQPRHGPDPFDQLRALTAAAVQLGVGEGWWDDAAQSIDAWFDRYPDTPVVEAATSIVATVNDIPLDPPHRSEFADAVARMVFKQRVPDAHIDTLVDQLRHHHTGTESTRPTNPSARATTDRANVGFTAPNHERGAI